MGTPYIAEIRTFSFNYAPKGWAFCNGQSLPIAQNQALFALLGTTYGGDGVTTFNLPNLQGCAPVHIGTPAGGSQAIALGQRAGEEQHQLQVAEMPPHNHPLMGASNTADATSPANNLLGAGNPGNFTPYANSGTLGQINPASITNNNGGVAHPNMQPYQVLNLCIALVGIFPPRN